MLGMMESTKKWYQPSVSELDLLAARVDRLSGVIPKHITSTPDSQIDLRESYATLRQNLYTTFNRGFGARLSFSTLYAAAENDNLFIIAASRLRKEYAVYSFAEIALRGVRVSVYFDNGRREGLLTEEEISLERPAQALELAADIIEHPSVANQHDTILREIGVSL